MSNSRKTGRSIARDQKLEPSPLKDAQSCYRRYKHKLTKEEQEWYENFLKGVYRGDKEALEKICPDQEKRQEIIDDYNYDHNSTQRYTPTEATRKTGYSINDYIEAPGASFESALVEVIDSEKKAEKDRLLTAKKKSRKSKLTKRPRHD